MKIQIVTLSLILLTVCSCTKEPMTDVGGPLGVLDVYNGDHNVSTTMTSFSIARVKIHPDVQMPTGSHIDVYLYDNEGYELQWLGSLYDDGEIANNDKVPGDGTYSGSVCYSRYGQPGSFYMMASTSHDYDLTSNKVHIQYVK